MLIDTEKLERLAEVLDEADAIGIDALEHFEDHKYLIKKLGELIDKNTEARGLI